MNITRNFTTSIPTQVVVYFSDNDIVPDEIQHRLIYWRDVFRMAQFDIGDATAETIIFNAKDGRGITHDRVFEAVANFCGKTPRTVRYYYETAVFYPIEIRQEFNVLPFSHFVEARVFGDRWREFLERSMLFPGKSVKYIRNQMVAVPPVAVGVAVGVGADVSNYDEPNYVPNVAPESEKNNCEISQDGTGNVANIRRSPVADQSCEVSQVYSQHAALCRIDALMTAVKDALPILADVRIDDFTRAKLASACGDLLHYLPKVGEVIAHSERMV